MHNRQIFTTFYSSNDKSFAAIFFDDEAKEYGIEYFNDRDKTTHIQFGYEKTMKQLTMEAEDWIMHYDGNYTIMNSKNMGETIINIACDNLNETCLEKSKRIQFYIDKYEFLANQSGNIE